MENSKDILKKFAIAKSKFFTIPENEEVKAKYLGAEEVPNNFDGGKTNCIRYHLEVDGVEKFWDRSSRDLAEQMANIEPGMEIFIKRIGQKNRTKYTIRKVWD